MVKDYFDFYSWEGNFYSTVKERVEKIVPQELRRYDWRMYRKTIVVLIMFFIGQYLYIFDNSFLSVVFFSFAAAQVGVNIMHDGNHFAFSRIKWLNRISGFSLELLGTSAIIWKRSHNFGHHGCVNHLELDRSFDTTYPLIRLHPGLPWHSYHKYQHYYGPIMFCFANFGDMFGQFDELYWLSNFPVRRGFISNKCILAWWVVIFYYISWAVVSPIYYHGFTHWFEMWWVWMLCTSACYVYFFAVNHWTTEAGMVDFMSITNNNWGKLQVTNSNNFANDKSLWCWLSGGLNF